MVPGNGSTVVPCMLQLIVQLKSKLASQFGYQLMLQLETKLASYYPNQLNIQISCNIYSIVHVVSLILNFLSNLEFRRRKKLYKFGGWGWVEDDLAMPKRMHSFPQETLPKAGTLSMKNLKNETFFYSLYFFHFRAELELVIAPCEDERHDVSPLIPL